ncbi:sialate O-acetylesterase [Pseudoduganella lurida]|uniref:Sialate O-acetylesterase n=1 Tax=Pseudoduganella lurida TaxID=1036180 RepID=A0A562RM41_9BURK|nr:sialate O-acetylesterase [Pseudoduganella lurida]TWI69520.1 sialate O-acetylesterase [Pseudoduganella lurida]
MRLPPALKLFPLAASLLAALPALAAVRLPAVLSEHMVLQRGAATPVWGWAEPGETVEVRYGEASAGGVAGGSTAAGSAAAGSRAAGSATASSAVAAGTAARNAAAGNAAAGNAAARNAAAGNAAAGSVTTQTRAGADGRWRTVLDLRDAPRAGTLEVRGATNTVTAGDVLLGDVWLASGQSNMQKPLGERKGERPTFDAPAEIAAAEAPDLRLFKVQRGKASAPQEDVAGQWVRCSPESIESSQFSAVGYFFGRRLQRELGVPLGLIDSSVGGTRIELWTPASALSQAGRAEMDSSALYNAMVAGLAPFALKGMLWYQGESNVLVTDDGATYTAKMAALVGAWRTAFGTQFPRQLPFYYVQIAPHLYHVLRHHQVLDAEAVPRLQEAQSAALRIPGTGMVVTTDLVDDLTDLHPRDKKSVGYRLANLALNETYGRKDIEAYGPVYRSLQVRDGRAVVTFDHGAGLFSANGKALTWFDVAGADGKWHPAGAVVERDRVIVTSPKVPRPKKVRFAWDEAAQPNLVNGAGLPARPFRSDHPLPPQARR